MHSVTGSRCPFCWLNIDSHPVEFTTCAVCLSVSVFLHLAIGGCIGEELRAVHVIARVAPYDRVLQQMSEVVPVCIVRV